METTLPPLVECQPVQFTESQVDECAHQYLVLVIFPQLFKDVAEGRKEAGKVFKSALFTLQKAKDIALNAIRRENK
jgi:hypothetical protein